MRYGLALILLFIAPSAWGQNAGYYSGLSILYPYKPVYCDKDGGGPCYGSPGDLRHLPKSAPLPSDSKWCEWAGAGDPEGKVDAGSGWVGLNGEGWYQWEPRTIATERQKYLGEKVCYLEDRGQPKNINDLKRDP